MRRYAKGDYFTNRNGEYILVERKDCRYYLRILKHIDTSTIGRIIIKNNLTCFTRE